MLWSVLDISNTEVNKAIPDLQQLSLGVGNDRHVSNDNVSAHYTAGTMLGAGNVGPKKKFPALKEFMVSRGR